MFLRVSAGNLDFHADFFRSLSDPSRLTILNALSAGPLKVGAIVSETQLRQSSVSNHLRDLGKVGLVQAERQGRFILYRLGDAWKIELPRSDPAQDLFLAARVELVSRLRFAKNFTNNKKEHDFPQTEFHVISLVMIALLQFLQTDPDIVTERLDEPLQRFIVNLGNLSEGRQPELLKPQPRRKPKSIADQAIMALAALALEEMVNGMNELLEQAAAKVARTIQAAKLPVRSRGEAKLASTIRGWRDRIINGSAPPHVLYLWQDYHRDPTRYGAIPAKRVEWLLNRLRHGPELRWS